MNDMSSVLTSAAEQPQRMQCMEVWGGNTSADRSFTTVGLRGWLYSRPFERADGGGDVYYVSSCASGRITRLLLADVSGHGEQAAAVATFLRDLMRKNINLINQSRLVRAMNRQFFDRYDLTSFATALVCTFFAPTRTLQFCNAGNPAPLLYRANENSWVSTHDVAPAERPEQIADTPLGVVETADYSRLDTKLSYGDMVLCLSDAFPESRNRDGNLLGADGLMRIVAALDVSDPATIIPQLIERISCMHSDNLTQDDATALLFQADDSKVRLKDNLLAPFRLLRPARDATQLDL